MKLLLIGDIHAGKSSESTTRPGLIRQASTEALDKLSSLLPHFHTLKIELVVNMGDMIREIRDKEIDHRNLRQTLEVFNKLDVPKIHILGNHDLVAFDRTELEQQYKDASIEPEFWGSRNVGGFQVIWLDVEMDQTGHAYLPEQRLEWLAAALDSNQPSILLSHYSVMPIDTAGNFLFEKEFSKAYYSNSDQILEVLSGQNTLLAASAHVHMLSHQVINQTHFISIPSFSENIAADQFPSNNPGIYSVLEIEDDGFTFGSYSGFYCFAKIEGKVNSQL